MGSDNVYGFLADSYESTLIQVQQIACNGDLPESERLDAIRELTSNFTDEPDPYWHGEPADPTEESP